MTTATDLADTVKAALTDTFEAPSRIARRAKLGKTYIGHTLDELVRSGKAQVRGNGCWQNYRAMPTPVAEWVVIETRREIATGIETHHVVATATTYAAFDAYAAAAAAAAPEGSTYTHRIRHHEDPFAKAAAKASR